MEHSYNNIIGKASPIWLIMSGGVKKAAIIRIITSAYLRLAASHADDINPTLASRVNKTGI